jgi:hypothetical protein
MNATLNIEWTVKSGVAPSSYLSQGQKPSAGQ